MMMRKIIKPTLIVLASLLVLVLIAGFSGWMYLKAKFLDFEGDYVEQTSFKTLNNSGYTFLDRNANGELDPYEDSRLSIDVRANNLLQLMTIEEKIHLLKGSGLSSAMGRVEEGTGIPGAVGTIVPTPRLGVPTVYLSDGPAGLRIEPTKVE